MARRRKKNRTCKAALEFAESPACCSPNCPSPVFCNDHPPTAVVVSIEDGANLSWVSTRIECREDAAIVGRPELSSLRRALGGGQGQMYAFKKCNVYGALGF